MRDDVLEFDYVQEYKDWMKSMRDEEKAQGNSIMSYFRRFKILELCGGNLALVYHAIKMLGQLLQDQAFRDEAQEGADALAALYPLVPLKPRIQGLRLELWVDPDPRLAALLASDGFRCVAAPGCCPQVYYGHGVLAQYKSLVQHPATVSPYDAEGAVQGRDVMKADDGAAAEETVAVDAPVNREPPASAPDRKRELRAALRAAAARTAKARDRACGAYESPPDGAPLHQLVASPEGDPLLIAIIRRQGLSDFASIIKHLRGSFGLGRITQATQGKVSVRLGALCGDGAIAVDERGRYYVPIRLRLPPPDASHAG